MSEIDIIYVSIKYTIILYRQKWYISIYVGKGKLLSQKTSLKVYTLYLLQLLNLILVKANFKSAYTSTRFQFDITAVQYSRRLI